MQEDATVIPSDTALRLATVNGAEALGFANVGALKTGNQADLVLISLDAPHLNPLHSVVSQLAYSARGSDVQSVFVAGRCLMLDRKLLTIDEERAIFEVKMRAKRLIASHSAGVRD